ncbi:hypothetical protein [Streptomyces phaeofaciens]|uniref:hypothetical protein n=1 Tax=Streptomyces phaeofaciens TaxID=68254 RepID=UPI00367B899D
MNAFEWGGPTGGPASSVGTGVEVHVYRVPSAPDRPQEWRDAAAVTVDRRGFALCDGASTAYRAGPWSRLLAREYITEAPDHSREALPVWVDHCQQKWNEQEAERRHARAAAAAVPGAEDRDPHRRAWDFWVDDAESRGVAKATLLGMRLLPATEGWSFEAVAVGDTCLLHLRGDTLLHAFPLADASRFGSHPDLLSTDEHLDGTRIHHYGGRLGPHDVVLLVTDALAEALLARTHAGDGAEAAAWWRVVRRLDETSFERLVTGLRAARQIERDDTTMIRIRPSANG